MTDQVSGERQPVNEPLGPGQPRSSPPSKDPERCPQVPGTGPGDPAEQDHVSGRSSSTELPAKRRAHRFWKWLTGTPRRKAFSGLGAILLAAVSGVAGTAASGMFTGSGPVKPIVTQSLVFAPWISLTRVAPDIHVAARVTGSCWTSSIASGRPDAYRCMGGNLILDPCFANPMAPFTAGSHWVACPFPAPNSITLIHFRGQLPSSVSASGPTDNAWLIILGDGERCPLITGGTFSPGGLRLNYQCHSGGLYGEPQENSPTWTIFEQRNGTSDMTLVPIAQAYS